MTTHSIDAAWTYWCEQIAGGERNIGSLPDEEYIQETADNLLLPYATVERVFETLAERERRESLIECFGTADERVIGRMCEVHPNPSPELRAEWLKLK